MLRPVLALLPLVVVSCAGSSLVDYARPGGAIHESLELDELDLIPYRALTRDDFRASAPPSRWAPVADRIGAATCGLIVPTDGIEIAARPDPERPGRFRTVARQLHFTAYMDRGCSWWNEQSRQEPDYVLEHEQLHFAIFELEARRLNAEADGIRARLAHGGATPEEALAGTREALHRELERALARALERTTRLDEDTSLSYRPQRQRVWAERLERELARQDAGAARHGTPELR